MDNTLQIKGLSKQYGMAPPIISNFSLSVKSGSITALTGRNGSGKSTFMKLLSMISKPDAGSIYFNGVDIWQKPEGYLSRMGIVADWFSLPEALSFEELLTWQMEEQGYDTEKQKQIIAELKELFDFDDSSKQVIRTYSSGMRKKTAICAALCINPSILLFDEPFQALDVDSRERLTKQLIEEKNNGKIIFLVSHLSHETPELFSHEIRFPL